MTFVIARRSNGPDSPYEYWCDENEWVESRSDAQRHDLRKDAEIGAALVDPDAVVLEWKR